MGAGPWRSTGLEGGASGMGLRLGECYAKEGANVVLADINQDALDTCVANIRTYHENVIVSMHRSWRRAMLQ